MRYCKEFTIFVDGLPQNMDSKCLKNIIKYKWDVIDMYASFKKRKSCENTFRFVHFLYEEDAERAISCLDGKMINSIDWRCKGQDLEDYLKEITAILISIKKIHLQSNWKGIFFITSLEENLIIVEEISWINLKSFYTAPWSQY